MRWTALIGFGAAAAILAGCQGRSVLKAEQDGIHHNSVGEYAQAEQDFAYTLDKSPGRVPSRLGMGKALMAQGKASQARPHLETAYSIEPNNDEVIDLLAEAMLKDGKPDEMTRLLKGRAEERQTVKEWVRYGKWAAKANDADGAENAYITAARIDKGQTVEPQIGLANLYEQVGDPDRAIQRLRMALYLRPQDIVIRSKLAALGANPAESFAIVPAEALQE